VVSQQSSLLAPLAVEAVLKVIDPAKDKNVDLKVFYALLMDSKKMLRLIFGILILKCLFLWSFVFAI
jgi:hypothetical protein